jgi:hypothetical protein
MNGTEDYYVEWDKPSSERKILFSLMLRIWTLKNKNMT